MGSPGMTAGLGGRDPEHDLSPKEKDEREKELRREARDCLRQGKAEKRKELLTRAVEISRRKSKKAHRDGD